METRTKAALSATVAATTRAILVALVTLDIVHLNADAQTAIIVAITSIIDLAILLWVLTRTPPPPKDT